MPPRSIDRDGVELRLRVGLNSGQVIAGEIGSGPLGYTAIGEQVGMAQRMESVAPPGGVMLSESTARLVDGAVALGESGLVQIKGAESPVAARRLLGMGDQHHAVSRAESNLVGRRWEMSAVEALLSIPTTTTATSSPASRCPTPGRWPARNHTCGGCKKTIPVGARHRRRFMLVDGEPWHEKTCRNGEYYQS